ncbi:MAG: hypothetical protein GXY37_09005 [Chloroflexi bacterium]|nr:hypothetical protein [Chloroflexota bacterium]
MNAADAAKKTSQAWATLEELSQRLVAGPFKGLRSVFAIGSLPGGYFRPQQSDLDVVALFNDPAPTGEALTALRASLAELTCAIKQSTDFEIECLLRFVSELGRDLASGLLINPDLVARLKLQSHQLFGSYPVNILPMPSVEEWRQEASRFLSYWEAKTHQDPTAFSSLPKQISKTLTLMRLYLAMHRNLLEYNKLKLPQRFEDSIPAVSLSAGSKAAIQTYLKTSEISQPATARLQTELPEFQSQLIRVIL